MLSALIEWQTTTWVSTTWTDPSRVMTLVLGPFGLVVMTVNTLPSTLISWVTFAAAAAFRWSQLMPRLSRNGSRFLFSITVQWPAKIDMFKKGQAFQWRYNKLGVEPRTSYLKKSFQQEEKKFVTDVPKTIECRFCVEKFASPQGLGNHVKAKHNTPETRQQ